MAFTEISAVIFVRTFSVDVSAKSGEIEIRETVYVKSAPAYRNVAFQRRSLITILGEVVDHGRSSRTLRA